MKKTKSWAVGVGCENEKTSGIPKLRIVDNLMAHNDLLFCVKESSTNKTLPRKSKSRMSGTLVIICMGKSAIKLRARADIPH